MNAPYFSDDTVSLYLGDMREVLPALGVTADLIVADPPYVSTPLPWDRWPTGWLRVASESTSSLWCFGTLRMFLDAHSQFTDAGWKLSQEVIWEKHNGSGFDTDRFKTVHETITHWYRGAWKNVYHVAPTTEVSEKSRRRGAVRAAGDHRGSIGAQVYDYDGTRIARSVIQARSMHGRAIHPTEKPVRILTPLIEYACPPGGLVVDPFAGSGSTLEAARLSGRRAIGVEADEQYAEMAARRLSQATLEVS
jgi:site-specific DNA-methyltransferase (adenine-specific)